jgi:hypothetical protein
MARPIDLPRIRRAQQRLDELARDHPELCQGEPWANHLDTLEELTMPPTPPQKRMADLRERRRAAGYREMSGLWLDPDAQKALDTLAQAGGGRSLSEIVSEALKALAKAKARKGRTDSPPARSK